MVIISNYIVIEKRQKGFFVKSLEESSCPGCNAKLEIIGSRLRKYIKSDGIKHSLVIRRLRCTACRKIHHEIPDMLLPYKRYDNESIETTLTSEKNLTVAAEKSTIVRWFSWFNNLKKYMLWIIIAVHLRYDYSAMEKELFNIPNSPILGIWHFVGNHPKWLVRAVRILTNTNSYLHTRFVFVSKT